MKDEITEKILFQDRMTTDSYCQTSYIYIMKILLDSNNVQRDENNHYPKYSIQTLKSLISQKV